MGARTGLVIECAKALGFPKSAESLRENGKCEVAGRKFRFALSPSNSEAGNLETLILRELRDTALFKCVELSIPCIAKQDASDVSGKAKVQMYLSAKSNSSMAGVRHAFRGRYFDVKHESYKDARSMVDDVVR